MNITRYQIDQKKINKALDSFYVKLKKEIESNPYSALFAEPVPIIQGEYEHGGDRERKIECKNFEYIEPLSPEMIVTHLGWDGNINTIVDAYMEFLVQVSYETLTGINVRQCRNGSGTICYDYLPFNHDCVLKDPTHEGFTQKRLNEVKAKLNPKDGELIVLIVGKKQFYELKSYLDPNGKEFFIICFDVPYDERKHMSHCLAFKPSLLKWAFGPMSIDVTRYHKNPILHALVIFQSLGAVRLNDKHDVWRVDCAEKKQNG